MFAPFKLCPGGDEIDSCITDYFNSQFFNVFEIDTCITDYFNSQFFDVFGLSGSVSFV